MAWILGTRERLNAAMRDNKNQKVVWTGLTQKQKYFMKQFDENPESNIMEYFDSELQTVQSLENKGYLKILSDNCCEKILKLPVTISGKVYRDECGFYTIKGLSDIIFALFNQDIKITIEEK